jgi:hypothetical protein
MDPTRTLIEKLKKRPELSHTEIPGGVRIEPMGPVGFAVELHGEEDGWTVYLGEGGFHESFETGEEALDFIAWCYSERPRLREVWRGPSLARAILEVHENGQWRCSAETVFFFVPIWRRRREEIRQNQPLV